MCVLSDLVRHLCAGTSPLGRFEGRWVVMDVPGLVGVACDLRYEVRHPLHPRTRPWRPSSPPPSAPIGHSERAAPLTQLAPPPAAPQAALLPRDTTAARSFAAAATAAAVDPDMPPAPKPGALLQLRPDVVRRLLRESTAKNVAAVARAAEALALASSGPDWLEPQSLRSAGSGAKLTPPSVAAKAAAKAAKAEAARAALATDLLLPESSAAAAGEADSFGPREIWVRAQE